MELSFAQKKILWKIVDHWARDHIGILGLEDKDYPRLLKLCERKDLARDHVNAILGHLLRLTFRHHTMTPKEKTDAAMGIKTLLTKCRV